MKVEAHKKAPRLAGGAQFEARLLGLAAGPDEGELAVGLGFDEGSVDGSRKARIVELDREVLAACAGGLFPSRAELDLMRSTA